jgi:8-oxo-dGTP pyrophosphatase MutT (NUDIX family)
VRETEEETGIQLKDNNLVGILNEPFTAYRKTTHTLITYAVVFYLFEAQEVKLNFDEISEFRWLPVSYFMREDIYRPIIIPFESFSFLI